MLNISQSKKTSEKRGKNSSKESRSQECKVQGRGGGGPTCNTRTSPLMQKKKETPQSILYYSIHRDEGVQEAEGGGGGGDLKDAWEAREIGEFTQQCSVSPSRKRDALQSCK